MPLTDKRIFVVEDNLENRIIFQFILLQEGAKVEFDRWGRDTIRRLQAFAPVDIILLDLMLGAGITGFQIYDEIRKVPEFAKTPVVAVSATDPATAIPKAKMKGFSGFIAKPVNESTFAGQLEKILGGEPLWYSGGRWG
jgi:two-component system, sensor histidine kinase and response regulator